MALKIHGSGFAAVVIDNRYTLSFSIDDAHATAQFWIDSHGYNGLTIVRDNTYGCLTLWSHGDLDGEPIVTINGDGCMAISLASIQENSRSSTGVHYFDATC